MATPDDDLEKSRQESLVSEFVKITNTTKHMAQAVLTNCNWNLEEAVTNHFAGQDDDDDSEPEVVMDVKTPPPPPAVPATGQSTAEPAKPVAAQNHPPQRFATLDSVRAKDDGNEEEGQAYFAGGSEHSGQQIVGPGKPRKPDKVVENLFQSAKAHGAEVVDDIGASGSGHGRAAPQRHFTGSGYTLGDGDQRDSEVVGGTSQTSDQQPRQVDMVLKMWQDGFSIDDGPVRGYLEEENRAFLSAIQRGEIPQELVQQARGGEVSLNMEDHRNEKFGSIKKKLAAFSGSGQKLGSPAPTLAGEAVPSAAPPPGDNSQPAAASVEVDQSQPTTSIQVRLADGTRLVMKFNQSHTVGDVRAFIRNSRPGMSAVNFILLTTFPNRTLDDDSATLKAANLLNAVIVQKIVTTV